MKLSRTNSKSYHPVIGRRVFLTGAGAVILGACTNNTSEEINSPPLTADTPSSTASSTSSEPSPSQTTSDEPAANAPVIETLTPAMFVALPTCVLTPSAAEGPFPSQAPMMRQEIHENLPGHPLRIGLRVVDQDCRAIPGATVDIWHTDASGDYSEYEDNGSGKDEGEGSTFCRGAQTSDTDGILEFLTIYPGWYEGRTVHIHATVRINDAPVLTTQLYLDESLTASIHLEDEYALYGPQDTNWSQDGAIGDPENDGSLLVTQPTKTVLGDGTLALINLGVEVLN